MARFVVLLLVTLLAIAMVAGCGQKAEEGADKAPVEVKEAEVADSTRMDSAAMEAEAMESAEQPADSM